MGNKKEADTAVKTRMAKDLKLKRKGTSSKSVNPIVVLIVGLVLIISFYLMWKYYHIQQKLITDESEETWLNIVFSKLWKSEKKDPTESSGIFSEIWNSIMDDFEYVRLCILGFISREVNPVVASFIQIACAMLLIFIITIGYSGYISWKTGKQSASKSKKKNSQMSWSLFTQHISIKIIIKTLAILALFISIPMEYMRMYQEQVATKVAHMKGGIPKECVPEEMNFMKTVKHWISWELSWIHEPCEKYHKALMVDPMYEISPLNVLWSVLVRGILHPIELLFSSVGKCLKLFFNEIPAQWQLLMFVLMVVVLIVVIMAACNYRLSLPFVKIEPKTPVTSLVTSGQRCGSIGGDTPRRNPKLCS